MNIIENNLFIPSNFYLQLKWFPGNKKAHRIFWTFIGIVIQNQIDSSDYLWVGSFHQNMQNHVDFFIFKWLFPVSLSLIWYLW